MSAQLFINEKHLNNTNNAIRQRHMALYCLLIWLMTVGTEHILSRIVSYPNYFKCNMYEQFKKISGRLKKCPTAEVQKQINVCIFLNFVAQYVLIWDFNNFKPVNQPSPHNLVMVIVISLLTNILLVRLVYVKIVQTSLNMVL